MAVNLDYLFARITARFAHHSQQDFIEKTPSLRIADPTMIQLVGNELVAGVVVSIENFAHDLFGLWATDAHDCDAAFARWSRDGGDCVLSVHENAMYLSNLEA